MAILPNIPTNPDQGAHWDSGHPFATTPAAAHAMLHPFRPNESRYSAFSYMSAFKGRNNPYYLMQEYWPAGASQVQALQGLGADPSSGVLAVVGGLVLGAVVVGAIVSGAAGYYAGKAVAPSDDSAKTYGKIGAAIGVIAAFMPEPVTVPAALGAMSATSHFMKSRG